MFFFFSNRVGCLGSLLLSLYGALRALAACIFAPMIWPPQMTSRDLVPMTGALQRPLPRSAIPLGLEARNGSATLQERGVCNLYSITTNQEAIIRLFRVMNRYVGNLAPMPGVFPDYSAPVIRNAGSDRELAMMRLGMPPPPRLPGVATNIRNTTSPHWRAWLKPENRCLVPANSFAEYAPEPNPQTKKKEWFGLLSMISAEYLPSPASGPSSGATAAPSQNQSPGLTWSTAS